LNEDTYLVTKALQGEQDAFDTLVRKYQDAIYGLAFHLIGNFADAQDITQQAFIKAYLKLDQLKDHSRFIHWLKRIVTHECVIWVRKQKSVLRLHEQIEINTDFVRTPDQEYESNELSTAVNEAMKELSVKNRLALTMYYIDGMSQNEIGDFLGVPATVIANRISRARKQLKEATIKMIEDTLKDNKLPDDFVQKVRNIIEKGKSFMHNGNMGEALKYSDEALNTLNNVQENNDSMRLKKEALWLKGQAVMFPLGYEETLKYSEEALELAQKIGDKREYALALVQVAYDYANVGQREKADECAKKALEICEETDYFALQAEIMMSVANGKLDTEGPEKALEYYKKAIELCEKSEELDYRSVCRSAVALINEVGISPGFGNLIGFGMLADIIEKKPDGIIFLREPGFGIGNRRTDYIWEGSFGRNLLYSSRTGDKILDYNMKVGDKQILEEFSFTLKPLIATRIIESDSETVEVIAGKFDNCLKIKGIEKPNPNDNNEDDTERIKQKRKLNLINCGTKHIWFAPGVGPVKFIFDSDDGVHVHIELAEYSVKDVGSDYFPLAIGNKWTYRWCGIDERYVTKGYYEVAGEKDGIYYLDHYAYAYFSGTKEEYDSLGQLNNSNK
jgi:RNA polymerase sigma-70 factor (ECF subfamily)